MEGHILSAYIEKESIVKKKYFVLLLMALAILFPNQVLAEKLNVRRIYGENRYETAVEISKDLYEKSETVIIGSGENYPDALVGGALAVQIDSPILLVRKNSIDNIVSEEIERLGAKKVFILGGEAAVGKGVENKIREKGLMIERLGGKDRFETSSIINDKRFDLRTNPQEDDSRGDSSYYAYGFDFPDALAVAPFCGQANEYLNLRRKGEDSAPGIAVGGPGVIKHSYDNDPTFKNLWEYDEHGEILSHPYRIFGKNRYETAFQVAIQYWHYFKEAPETTIIANGKDYPDALAAANLAGRNKGVILLTDPKDLPQVTKKHLEGHGGPNVIVVGGEAAVSDQVVQQIKNIERVSN